MKNVMSKILLQVLVLVSIAFEANASNSFKGSVIQVVSPSMFVVANEAKQTLEIEVRGYQHNGETCAENAHDICDALEQALLGIGVGVIVEGHVGGKVFGDITFDGEVLSNYVIREGYYRINVQDGRHRALLVSEREAVCNYRRIWAQYRGQHEYAAICQGR